MELDTEWHSTMRLIHEQKKERPKLLDIPIEAIRNRMIEVIPWLDQSFGRAWRVTRNIGGKKYVEPCVYCGGEEYETLIPSADLGNYCFWLLHDPTDVDEDMVSAKASVIFFVDLRTAFDGHDKRDTEVLKNDIIKAFRHDLWVKGARLEVEKVYEDAKNVFQGLTVDENENQFTMQPYCSFRVEVRLTMFVETC